MSGHYTDGRRWSYISKAWIFADGWNDREEIARLEAKVRELEERLAEQKQLTEHAEASEEYARAEWTKDLAHLQDLEATLRQVEEERDQWKKALHILTPGGSEFANDPAACVEWIRKTRSSQHNTILAFKGERDQLRARVEELEEVLRASRIGLDDWLNQYASELCGEERVKEAVKRIEYHGGTLAYIASLQDKNKRALEGKEEHGRRDE